MHFWFQIYAFLIFNKILQLKKFEGAGFKYDSIFFKIRVQKYTNQAFLIPNLKSLIFAPNFATRQNREFQI